LQRWSPDADLAPDGTDICLDAAHRHAAELRRIGDDNQGEHGPRSSIDNNLAERVLRIVAIGRKNWLFAGSDAGAERAAIIYSLIASCKLSEIDPFEYLRDVLERVSTHPASKIAELTPSGWKRHFATPK
jgi:hypothetical protein